MKYKRALTLVKLLLIFITSFTAMLNKSFYWLVVCVYWCVNFIEGEMNQ